MWTTNQGLTDRHAFDSRPEHWPVLRRGIVSLFLLHPFFPLYISVIFFLQNFWVKDHRQIYLIGNIFVWYLGTFGVLSYVAVRGFLLLRQKRGYRDFENSVSFLHCLS
jgi:dolichyl-phosphate-mannose-protein mannosyltransferase